MYIRVVAPDLRRAGAGGRPVPLPRRPATTSARSNFKPLLRSRAEPIMRTKKRGEERRGEEREGEEGKEEAALPCLAVLALADPPHQDMLRYFFLSSFLLKLHNYRDHRSSNHLDKQASLLLFKIRTERGLHCTAVDNLPTF